jgi:hypothetical protein
MTPVQTAKVVQRWLLFEFLIAVVVVPPVLPLGIDILRLAGIYVAIYFLGIGFLVVSPFSDPQGLGLVVVWVVAVVFWGWIGFCYARFTHRIRTFHFVLLTYPVIVAVNYVLVVPVLLLLGLLGIEPDIPLP